MRYKEKNNTAAIIGGGLAALAIAGVSAFSIASALHLEQSTINVVSKERLQSISTNSDGKVSSKQEYWVYSDQDTYRVADSLLQWHFHSGQVYARVTEGAACDVTLQGYRIGFLSMMQNIIAVDCHA